MPVAAIGSYGTNVYGAPECVPVACNSFIRTIPGDISSIASYSNQKSGNDSTSCCIFLIAAEANISTPRHQIVYMHRVLVLYEAVLDHDYRQPEVVVQQNMASHS
jgi:hypothetical protein